MALFLPHTELVAVAWLRGIPGIPSSGVGTTLPRDSSAWPDGFVQVTSGVGGGPHRDVPQHQPVVQVDCWAANPSGSRPPWGRANQLAEIIAAHCYGGINDAHPVQRRVSLPDSYQDARVQSAIVLTDPRRVEGDEARYACYSIDLQLFWVPVIA